MHTFSFQHQRLTNGHSADAQVMPENSNRDRTYFKDCLSAFGIPDVKTYVICWLEHLLLGFK